MANDTSLLEATKALFDGNFLDWRSDDRVVLSVANQGMDISSLGYIRPRGYTQYTDADFINLGKILFAETDQFYDASLAGPDITPEDLAPLNVPHLQNMTLLVEIAIF